MLTVSYGYKYRGLWFEVFEDYVRLKPAVIYEHEVFGVS